MREWQTVTVASACISSSAIGLPTMSLRPSTTARRPASATPLRGEQLHDARRRAGHEARPLLHAAAPRSRGGSRPRPSPAARRRARAARRPARGSGSCTRMPWISGRRFRSSTAASTSSVVALAAQPARLVVQAQLLAARASCSARRPPRPGRRRRAARRGRAGPRARASASSSPRSSAWICRATSVPSSAARSSGRCYSAHAGRGPRPLRDGDERRAEGQRARPHQRPLERAAARASGRSAPA